MKSKQTIMFVCQECGYESASFLGKCPECGTWNSLKEFKTVISDKRKVIRGTRGKKEARPQKLEEISYEEKERFKTGFTEMDGVLGGGFVGGSVVLLAGDPGIGKSTLLLQMAFSLAKQAKNILYVSGEESEQQLKLRANRLDKKGSKNLSVLSITNTDLILDIIEDTKPDFVIVDSIQAMESENLEGLSGSVGQVRYGAFELIKLAKSFHIPIVIVGHVTKEGMVAGPMILSHMVDVVLFLQGEKNTGTRILRSLKNRFGPVDEVGIFSMQADGMKEITNPESLFMPAQKEAVPGSVMVVTLEGTRAFMVELQALVVFSKLPMPRRVATGVDPKRVELLLAVLQKHCNLPIGSQDVFVNVAGGLRVSDPACDLGICLALYSSLKNVPLSKTVGVAEVGLLGELRMVPFLEKRIKEAKKLGYKTIITAETNKSLVEVIRSLK